MSLKDRINKRQQTHEKGYVSFTEEDLNEAKVNNQVNEEAYELLDAAMRTSSHLTEEDRNGDSVTIDDIYPCTEAECDEMDDLLNKAEKAAKDPNDSFFKERLGELRDIVDWSRKKHWTFQWSLILGCVLSIFGMMYLRSDAKDSLARREAERKQIENWVEQDTTIAYEKCAAEWVMIPLTSANENKAARLQNTKYYLKNAEKSLADYTARLDTCTSKDRRKSYQRSIESSEKSIKKYTERYAEINGMKFKEYKKFALKEQAESVSKANKHAIWMWIFLIYVILLIPAYIYSSHQFGYNITRHRTENKVLGGVQKVGFAIAGFFLGSGLAMSLLPDYEVVYSDGSTETKSDTGNIAIIAIKLILMFIGLLIFCITSVIIMTYVTIAAAKRDHDWSKVTTAASSITKKAVDKVKESGVVDKVTEAAKGAVDKVKDKVQK